MNSFNELVKKAKDLLKDKEYYSTAYIQKELDVNLAVAGRICDALIEQGIIDKITYKVLVN